MDFEFAFKMIKSKRKFIYLMIKIAVGAIILFFVIWSVNIKEVKKQLLSVNLTILIVVWALYICDRFLMAYKWRILLQPYQVTISLLQATRLYFVSNFLATFSPGGLGGDAYRVIALSGFNKNKIITYTVIIERFIGLVVLGTFALITLPLSIGYFNISYRSITWLIILISFLVVLFILFIIFPKYAGGSEEKLRLVYGNNFILKIRSYFESIVITKNHYKTISLFTLLCGMEVGLLIFMNYLAAISIGVYIKLGYFFCTLPILYLLLRLPITIQGIGIQEGLWAYIFSLAGYSASDGLAMSLLLRILEIIAIFIPAGIIFLTGSIRIPKSKNI